MSEYSIKKLYGGAIDVLMLSRLNSLGETLPIPDAQEVFSDPLTRCSYIVELLERTELEDFEAIRFIYKDIVEANQATAWEIISERLIYRDSYLLEGKITVNNSPVWIYLVVVRILQHQSDVSFYIADPDHEFQEHFASCLLEFARSFKVIDTGLFG